MEKKNLLFVTNGGTCVYVSVEFGKFECDHYFSSIRLCGPTFYGRRYEETDYKDMATIFTKEQIDYLFNADKTISSFGYGITKDSDKYNECIKKVEEIRNTILSWFETPEYKEWVEEVKEEEIQKIAEELNIDTEEAEQIVNEYSEYTNGYFDYSMLACVYDNYEDVGINEVDSYGDVPKWLEDYIDYEKIGEDYVSSNYCWELSDGRIITFQE